MLISCYVVNATVGLIFGSSPGMTNRMNTRGHAAAGAPSP